MDKKHIFYLMVFFIFSCQNEKEIISIELSNDIVPVPKEVTFNDKDRGLAFSKNISVSFNNPTISSLVEIFKEEIQKVTSLNINFLTNDDNSPDLIFNIDKTLNKEEYQIDINEKILVSAGSYNALVMAKNSLLQLITKKNKSIVFPLIKIKDYPDSSYRGLLIDLARVWHDVGTLKDIIDLASFYKINYIQLHLTDDQAFTFPTEKYPKLPTPDRPYSKKDFRELVEYAKLRGVILVPELEVPGHATQLVKIYPEIFGVNNNNPNSNVVNISNEKIYGVLDEIIGEMVEVFHTSPYFHIGADEANLDLYKNVPEIKRFMKKNNLGTDVNELYRYFIVRMNDIVKSHNKKMFLWEGFRKEGKIKIPKDVVVFEFETLYQLPGDLIEDGYTVVNTSWQPLYVVNGGVKNPRARRAMWSPEKIYSWNIWRWENWYDKAPASKKPIQLEETPLVIGGQFCSWEQAGEAEIPVLRKRLPSFIEKVWNNKEVLPFEVFFPRVEKNDEKLSKIINDKRQDTLLLGYNYPKVGDCGSALWGGCD